MTPARWTWCHRSVIAAWVIDGTRDMLCLRCIHEAFEVTRDITLTELLRRLGVDKP